VSRLDRLARSTLDLLSILRRVTDAGAKFRSLKDPWADTTTPHGKLMSTILAGLATFERHLIKARTDEGVKVARARGARFGRPPKLTPFQRQEAIQRLVDGESQADVAGAYNVDPAAICRLAAASHTSCGLEAAAISPKSRYQSDPDSRPLLLYQGTISVEAARWENDRMGGLKTFQ
jgi:DNA invertase Pin-like site-specific DNA recombinase